MSAKAKLALNCRKNTKSSNYTLNLTLDNDIRSVSFIKRNTNREKLVQKSF